MALMLRPSSFALRPSPFDKLRVRKLRVRKLGVRKLRVRKLGVRKLGTRKGSYQFALTLPPLRGGSLPLPMGEGPFAAPETPTPFGRGVQGSGGFRALPRRERAARRSRAG
jgi:hypothetical protein